MVATTEQLQARPGREAELEQRLRALGAASRSEPGCHEVRVARSQHDPRVFLVMSRYADAAALAQHTREPHYVEALPALMDCLEEPPVVALFDELDDLARAGDPDGTS